MPELLFPFLGVVALLTITPGPDMLLVVRNGLSAGSRAAWLTGLGCCLGISIHATAAVLGLSAILAASATAYTVVKLAGAAYLAYLGVRMLISALMSVDTAEEAEDGALPATSVVPEAAVPRTAIAETAVPANPVTTAAERIPAEPFPGATPGRADGVRSASLLTGGAVFRQGLITNLLNPKIALLFLTLLPQFVAHDEPRLRTTATLAVIFLAVAVVWWRTFSLAIGPISRVLRGGTARRVLDGLAGFALLAISAAVAFEGDR
ncbi:LysE family translocator [Actinoallomurus rhizosphaericola]|uniref:LysE family translocator n=1 Tax=Actinoallomurus rhizosphaericola TaxID=2952536 RepID=UPI0020932C5C|nr:LysE family transporter [Actinoallomurus rhizosphaericola]MCO5998375.1 LysE family translocator [Actinoallomurus rhizosphaericola]